MADAPSGVLWDMDGTLIDTEPYWLERESALVASFGGTWSHEDGLALVGRDLRDSAAYLRANSPITLEPEEIIHTLSSGVMERMRERMPWRPGARELLVACADAGVRCALVTMSWRPMVDVLLAALPPGTFEVVVTGDQVTHGKPHPEPYSSAAAALGVEPGECLAIEDSPSGVRSALAAGVRTVTVPHLVPIPDLPGLGRVDSLAGQSVQTLWQTVLAA